VNLKEIQRRLGHKSMEITTRKYIHATDEMQRQSLEIMNRMYQAK
jgi:integrase